jgi:hypothetical protein
MEHDLPPASQNPFPLRFNLQAATSQSIAFEFPLRVAKPKGDGGEKS